MDVEASDRRHVLVGVDTGMSEWGPGEEGIHSGVGRQLKARQG